VCRFSDPNQEEPDYECWTPLGAGISTHPFLTLEEGECLWTNDDVLVPNYIEKFHHWNQDPNEYIFTNYQDFSILPTTDHLHSYLRDIHSATIRTDLISGGTGGTIKFKDPWLPDGVEKLGIHKNRGMDGAEWYPHNTSLVIQPNESDFYRGVFKNQGLPLWYPPYYRVRVENPQYINFHGQSTTWYFKGWQGTNVQFQDPNQLETGVAFTDDDAEAKAVYKGHLASNIAGAVGPNSQRKVLYDGTIYHMVYEDNGEIYYTYYEDGEWKPEFRLSDGSGLNKQPCISSSYYVAGGKIGVVWQKDVYILLRVRSSSSDWSTIKEVNDFADPNNATPLIDYGVFGF